MRKRSIVILAVAIVAFLIGCVVLFSYNDHTYKNVVVTDKIRVLNGDNSYYFIFGKDINEDIYYEFRIADNILRMDYNPTQLYNQIYIDEAYYITVVGYSFKPLSMHENIVSIAKIPD